MSVIYLKEQQDPFECCGIPAHVMEVASEAGVEERLPGAGRRNWVYREIAMLGADATPSVDAIAWLEDIAPE
jgi:hypothetical protein